MKEKKIFLIYLGRTGAGPKLTLDFTSEILKSSKINNFNLLISNKNKLKHDFIKIKSNLNTIKTPSSNKELILNLPGFIIDFYKIIKKSKKDKIKNFFFIMTHPYNIISIILIKILIRKSNIIYICHAYNFPNRSLRDFIEKIIIRLECLFSNKIITLSKKVKSEIKKSFSKKDINNLFHPLFKHKNKNTRRSLSENPTFLLFGRILKYKGIDILIPSFEKLSEENNKIKLIIAGEGEIEEKDIKKIQLINNKYNNIILKNYYIKEEEIDKIWDMTDISITPYLNSLQSGVIPIAINKAIPSIITPHNALIEQCLIKTNSPVGLCSSNISSDSLFNEMKKIINKNLYEELSENCIKAQKELSWNIFLEKILILLK